MNTQPEIEFPADWTYRVLCLDRAGIKEEIETVITPLKPKNGLEVGNKSSSGKYITYKFTTVVHSLKELHGIPQLIAKIEGVKQIL